MLHALLCIGLFASTNMPSALLIVLSLVHHRLFRQWRPIRLSRGLPHHALFSCHHSLQSARCKTAVVAIYGKHLTICACGIVGGSGSGMRSVQSTSALGCISSNFHGACHRAIQGHRTHGSQSALNFLYPNSSYSPPRVGEVEQALTQSAPTLGAGASAHDVHNVACGQAWGPSHGRSRGQKRGVDPSGSASDPPNCSRSCSDNCEALAGLR